MKPISWYEIMAKIIVALTIIIAALIYSCESSGAETYPAITVTGATAAETFMIIDFLGDYELGNDSITISVNKIEHEFSPENSSEKNQYLKVFILWRSNFGVFQSIQEQELKSLDTDELIKSALKKIIKKYQARRNFNSAKP